MNLGFHTRHKPVNWRQGVVQASRAALATFTTRMAPRLSSAGFTRNSRAGSTEAFQARAAANAAKLGVNSQRAKLSAGSVAWLSQPSDEAEPFMMVDIEAVEEAKGEALVKPKGARVKPWIVKSELLAARNDDTQPDNVQLFEFSQAALLDNVTRRYDAAEPYTYTGDILTSVNPCEKLPKLYAGENMVSYVGQKRGPHRPPHLFAVAEEAYRLVVRGGVTGNGQHQGLVVSGVSGAGKTEANKIM